jgi:hypothetical protein
MEKQQFSYMSRKSGDFLRVRDKSEAAGGLWLFMESGEGVAHQGSGSEAFPLLGPGVTLREMGITLHLFLTHTIVELAVRFTVKEMPGLPAKMPGGVCLCGAFGKSSW